MLIQRGVQPIPWITPTAKTPKARTNRKARLQPFPVFVLFRPVIAGKPGRPDKRRGTRVSCFHPVAYGEVAGAGLCPVTCFSPVIYRERRLDRALAAARAIPARAGTGRPHRRSRRVRSRRSPPPCGRRGRARGRRAPPGGYWASPSPRRGAVPARSPIRRDAG